MFLVKQIGSMLNEKGELVKDIGEGARFLLVAGTMMLAVIWKMLEAGFLSTSIRGGCGQQQPGRLVIEGKRFFWRMVRFNFIIFSACMIIFQLYIVMLYGMNNPENIPELILRLGIIISLIFLTRPLLLVPAIMLVKDCMVFDAFSLIRNYRLYEGKGLVAVYWFGVVCSTLLPLLTDRIGTGVGGDVFLVIYSFAAACFMFIVSLAAVRFVAVRSIEPIDVPEDQSGKGYFEE